MDAAQQLASKFRRLVELRDKRDITKASLEVVEKEYRDYEADLWDQLEASPIQGTIKIDLGDEGVVTFQRRETVYGRILDTERALEYFEQRALTDEYTEPKLVKRRVNELVRDCVEAGKPVPAGLDFYAQRFISISKKK
jgi:hypothetical protein